MGKQGEGYLSSPSMSAGPAEEAVEDDFDSSLASSSVVAIVTPSKGLGGERDGG